VIVWVPVAQGSEMIVVRWVEAFNARDLDGMLACLAEDVDFYPLRLNGMDGRYRGHDGVREWFANLRRSRHEHQIVVSETRDLGQGRVLASGSLSLGGPADVGSFCAVNRIHGELIIAAHHYLRGHDRAPWSDPVSVASTRDQHRSGALVRRVIEVLERSSRLGAPSSAEQRRRAAQAAAATSRARS